MATLRSDDGFEFETTRADNVIRCVCRRDGRASAVEVRCVWPDDPALVQPERLELIARNLWYAAQREARRGRPDHLTPEA